jgi:hypothetical protein
MVRSLSGGALIYSRLCRTESPAGAAAPRPLSQLKVRFRLFGSEATSVGSFSLPGEGQNGGKKKKGFLKNSPNATEFAVFEDRNPPHLPS